MVRKLLLLIAFSSSFLIAQTSGGNNGSGTDSITSVFGRTGAVVAESGDYSFSQLSDALANGQLPNPMTTPGAATITGNITPSTNSAYDLGLPSVRWDESFVGRSYADTFRNTLWTKPVVTRGGIGTRGAGETALEVMSSGGRFIWGVMADSNRWGSMIGDTNDVNPTVRVGDDFRAEMSAWVDEGLMLSRFVSRIATALTANAARGDKFIKVASITGATLDHTVGIGLDDSVDIKEINYSSNDTIYLRRPLQYDHLSGDSVIIDKWRGSIFPVSTTNLPSGTLILGAEQTAAESLANPIKVVVANKTMFSTHKIGIGTEAPIVPVDIQVPTLSSVPFSITASDINVNRSTGAQARDTAALWYSFTGSGKPQFQMQGIAGASTFKVDSNGVGNFINGGVIVADGNTAKIEIDGTDASQTAGQVSVYESGGEMFLTSRHSTTIGLDNDANASASFIVKANGTGGTTVFSVDETGAITGSSVTRGSDAFTTTATEDTVTITGAGTGDYYSITLTGTAAPLAVDAIRLEKTATGFILHRSAAGTSGLTYDWIRIK